MGRAAWLGALVTFKDLQDVTLDECGYDNTQTSSTARTRTKRRLNDIYRRLLRDPSIARLLRTASKYTFASSSDVTTYGLPLALGRVDQITETTNDLRLELRTVDWLRQNDPGLTATGTPCFYILKGWYPIQQQPVDASTLVVRSSDAADTTQTARIEYIDSSGNRALNSVTLNGSTARTLAASGAIEVTEFYLSAAAAGVVRLYEDDIAGQVLVALPIGYTAARYLHIQLWPTPASAVTYNVDYTRELADLVQDKEEPLIPPDFHDVLWRGAVADEWVRKDDTRYQICRQEYELALKQLRDWVWNQTDYLSRPDDARPKYSRLGGWYPSGT